MLNNPVDGVMRLKKALTLTDPAGSITISLDDNGNAFSLKSAKILAHVPANTNAQGMNLRVNGINTNDYYSGVNPNLSWAQAGFMDTLFSAWETNINIVGGQVIIITFGERVSSTPTPAQIFFPVALYNKAITNIHSFFLWPANSGNIPSGTVIEIWGADA
jgi:hypothetical protein